MRTAISLILMFMFVQSVIAQDEDLWLELKDATKQNWVSTKPGGRSGNKFAIKVVVNTTLKASFKNLWIGEENVPFDASVSNETKLNPGDSVMLTYNMVKDVVNDNSEAPKLPFKYTGAALVEANIDGKPRYLVVSAFRELKE